MNRILWTLIIAPVCLSSCFLTRKKTGTNGSTAVISDTTPVRPVAAIPAEKTDSFQTPETIPPGQLADVVRPIWNKRITYCSFTGKANASYDDNEFVANFRVRKDSLIWINIIAFGAQFARILITPDSFYMVDQIHEEIIFRPLSEATKALPSKIDFASIQNLLLGEPLRDGNLVSAASLDSFWSLQVEDSSYIQKLSYRKNDSTLSSVKMNTRVEGPEASEVFTDYQNTVKGKIAMKRSVTVKGKTDHELTLKIQKLEFDVPLEFPFPVPRGFTVK